MLKLKIFVIFVFLQESLHKLSFKKLKLVRSYNIDFFYKSLIFCLIKF